MEGFHLEGNCYPTVMVVIVVVLMMVLVLMAEVMELVITMV